MLRLLNNFVQFCVFSWFSLARYNVATTAPLAVVAAAAPPGSHGNVARVLLYAPVDGQWPTYADSADHERHWYPQ